MQLENMMFFDMMVLMQYVLVLPLVAGSSVYPAQCTLKACPVWTETLKHHTVFRLR